VDETQDIACTDRQFLAAWWEEATVYLILGLETVAQAAARKPFLETIQNRVLANPPGFEWSPNVIFSAKGECKNMYLRCGAIVYLTGTSLHARACLFPVLLTARSF